MKLPLSEQISIFLEENFNGIIFYAVYASLVLLVPLVFEIGQSDDKPVLILGRIVSLALVFVIILLVMFFSSWRTNLLGGEKVSLVFYFLCFIFMVFSTIMFTPVLFWGKTPGSLVYPIVATFLIILPYVIVMVFAFSVGSADW